jgi:hypothetical protein
MKDNIYATGEPVWGSTISLGTSVVSNTSTEKANFSIGDRVRVIIDHQYYGLIGVVIKVNNSSGFSYLVELEGNGRRVFRQEELELVK